MRDETRSNADHLGNRGSSVPDGFSVLATVGILIGCVVVVAHLLLGGTSSLVRMDGTAAWPYALGFALIVLGLVLHVLRPAAKQDVVITIGSGVVCVIALPVAWLLFGFAGIGLGDDRQVAALLAAHTASVLPIITAFTGGVVSWRTRTATYRHRRLLMGALVCASLVVSVGLLVWAGMSFPGGVER
ncbi:hypothetical protein SAMN04487788_2290 [Microbacterium testaceum StLB037]|uniref:Uncharacterized protein n=1 Tax=Microbacterium testaceum (strain StLB037) TaxID=979556 RepID=A0A1H0Q861_MICTS|nr:hypothetical protein SAMN04487788_2290 [Microbacterium testaceum StLB037]